MGMEPRQRRKSAKFMPSQQYIIPQRKSSLPRNFSESSAFSSFADRSNSADLGRNVRNNDSLTSEHFLGSKPASMNIFARSNSFHTNNVLGQSFARYNSDSETGSQSVKNSIFSFHKTTKDQYSEYDDVLSGLAKRLHETLTVEENVFKIPSKAAIKCSTSCPDTYLFGFTNRIDSNNSPQSIILPNSPSSIQEVTNLTNSPKPLYGNSTSPPLKIIERSRIAKMHRWKLPLRMNSFTDFASSDKSNYGLGLRLENRKVKRNPSISVNNEHLLSPNTIKQSRAKSEGDLAAMIREFSEAHETISAAKDLCDNDLKQLMSEINELAETCLNNHQHDSTDPFIDALNNLSGICSTIVDTELSELFDKNFCSNLIKGIQTLQVDWQLNSWESSKYPLRVLLTFSGLAHLIQNLEKEPIFTSSQNSILDSHPGTISGLRSSESFKNSNLIPTIWASRERLSPIISTNMLNVSTEKIYKSSHSIAPKSHQSSPLAQSHIQDDDEIVSPRLVETSMMMEIDENCKVMYISSSCYDILGFTALEITQASIIPFIDHMDNSIDAAIIAADTVTNIASNRAFFKAFDYLFESSSVLVNFIAIHKDGSTIELEAKGALMMSKSSEKHSFWVVSKPKSLVDDQILMIDGAQDFIFCHICERSISAILFEDHSRSCAEIHRAEMDLNLCNDSIKEKKSEVSERISEINSEIEICNDGDVSEFLEMMLGYLKSGFDQLTLASEIHVSNVSSGEFAVEFNGETFGIDLSDAVDQLSSFELPPQESMLPFEDIDDSNGILCNLGGLVYQALYEIKSIVSEKMYLIEVCKLLSERHGQMLLNEEGVKLEIAKKVGILADVSSPIKENDDQNFAGITVRSAAESETVGSPPPLIIPPIIEITDDEQSSSPILKKPLPTPTIVTNFISSQLGDGYESSSTANSSPGGHRRSSFVRAPRMLLSSNKTLEIETINSPVISGSPLVNSHSFFDNDGLLSPQMRNSTPLGTGQRSANVSTTNLAMISKSNQPSIKDFEILKPISKGAYGSVFLAKRKVTGEYHAIKVLRKADMIVKNQASNVKAERMILTSIDSPFVAKMYFTFQSKDYVYLVMEYLNGGDCAALIKAVGYLDAKWARQYVAEIVLGLEFLHSRGIIHRDMKPDNILIDSKGHLKLTDFGLSKAGFNKRGTISTPFVNNDNFDSESSNANSPVPDGLTRSASFFNSPSSVWAEKVIANSPNSKKRLSGHSRRVSVGSMNSSGSFDQGVHPISREKFVGTPDYLAPESILGLGQDGAVDWWALGAITYEFLHGFPPFHADTPPLVFDNILARRFEWFDDEIPITDEAKSLIDGFLTLKVEDRLGSRGVAEIRSHDFFSGMDWDCVLSQESDFVPMTKNIEDTEYFDDRGAKNQKFDVERIDSDQQLIQNDIDAQADFGQNVYKNLPLLEKANQELVDRLRSEMHLSPNRLSPERKDLFLSNSNFISQVPSAMQSTLMIADIFSARNSNMNLEGKLSRMNSEFFIVRDREPSTAPLGTPKIGDTAVSDSVSSSLPSQSSKPKQRSPSIKSSPLWNFANSSRPMQYSELKCLIADDNPLCIRILERILDKAGFICSSCFNGSEAIQMAMGDVKYDLIFMDIRMPILDGENACRMIKNAANINQFTPIVGMTAYESANEKLFDAFLMKPLKKDRVMKAVLCLVESH